MKFSLQLLLIVLIAVILRFYQLGINPPSLTWDEAAWGYNSYSLGIDGKDEFGRFLPLDYLESFGDFKPPMYAYLGILPVKFFGLNEFAVRFPSAFFGVLTIIVTYFLTKTIFKDSKLLQIGDLNLGIPELAALILAISPWHINLSRAAFEANVATFFIASGVWQFLTWIENKKWYYLFFSATFFIFSIYTFNTARIVSPLLILILAISFFKKIIERKRDILIALFVGTILIMPTFKFLFTPQAALRFKEVNIFSDINVVKRSNQEVINDNNMWWSKIIHNRRFEYTLEYFRHYFDNLNPSFLFIKGDGNPKFSTQDVGELYFFEIPFLVLGFLFLFKRKEGFWWIIPLWIIIGIIPAATARETPHALRIETTLPAFQLLTAYGMVAAIRAISNIRIKYLIFSMSFLFLIFNFLYYLHGYYVHYPREYSGEWQYGYRESINYIKSVKNNYDKIYFTDALGRPYIYFLFYTKYDPAKFRKNSQVDRDVFGFVHVNSFDKYVFNKSLIGDNKKEKVLYIDKPSSVPGDASIKKIIYLLNGEQTLTAYEL